MSGNLSATQQFTVTNAGLPGGSANGAEVTAYDAAKNLIYVLGGQGVDALNATTGALVFSISAATLGVPVGTANSVAVHGDTLAFSLDGPTPASNGHVAFFTVAADGLSAALGHVVEVGAVPDMVKFNADGTQLLVAIEGEPAPSYTSDPAGGIAMIDVATGTSTFYGFEAFDAQAAALRAAGVKITHGLPGTPEAAGLPSTDFEPEYITIAGDRAFVTLQENNAIGVFNLNPSNGPVGWTAILPLGLSDHSLAGNAIDTSDRDGGALPRQVPIKGMYMPDAIQSFEMGGKTYLITANEGDAREWGSTVEAVRIADLVPASGSTPPVGMPALDPTLLAQIQSRRGDADLGRLNVSRWAGDTDGDGDLDQLMAFGGRSFSIWEVGGSNAAPTITQVYDSGQLLGQIIASQMPALYDDNRSDDKGVEPEGMVLGTIDGQLYAFVGLERANANLAFRIDSPTSVTYAGMITRPGDVAPEVSTFIPANGSDPARFVVASETSGTTTAYSLAPQSGHYRLQILHASDFEGGLAAVTRADRFAAIVDKLEDMEANSITLSSGDNYIPGPFAAAGTDPSVLPALRAYYEQALGLAPGSLTGLGGTSSPFFATDIAILNAIGINAAALGNHDFDLGTNPLNAAIDFAAGTSGTTLGRITNIGAQFPLLSANLNFSADPNIRAAYTAALREASTYATTNADLTSNQTVANEAADAQIAPWTTINRGGQTIGVLAVTTQLLASISSTGATTVLDPAGDGGRDNMAELASIIQPLVDQMEAQGINKIILLSHLQQYQNELALAPLLRGVDIIVAGGSDAIFADGTDPLRPGDTAAETYPQIRTGTDGKAIMIVNTGGEYSYVGRLVVEFDENGVLIADPDGAGPLGVGGVNGAVSGAYATTDETVAALWGDADAYADGTRGGEVRQLLTPVANVIQTKDGAVFGQTEVFLEGRRGEVRTEETNFGSLSADANLWQAKQLDAGVMVSIKNGGGIRAEIGTLSAGAVPVELPPAGNPDAGKPEGGISQLDIENSLRFNNALSIVTVTAENLERIFEHSVAAVAPGATPGQFGQVGGVSFSYDPTKAAQVQAGGVVSVEGQRIQNLVILNENGSIADTIMKDGVLQGDPTRLIKLVTLSFLADGGDGYPIGAYAVNRVDLLNNAGLDDGAATFAAKGSEQDAFAEYMARYHNTEATAYDTLDTTAAGDLRVQNLSARADTVGLEYAQVTIDGVTKLQQFTKYSGPVSYLQMETRGTDRGEVMILRDTNDFVNLGGGDDAANGGAGNDVIDGGTGSNFLTGGSGSDVFFLDIRNGGSGPSTWSTITDFRPEDQLSIFGWRPGVSRSSWVENAGAEGYKGATLHIDVNNDNRIDASVTFTGMTQAQVGTPVAQEGLLWFL